MSRQYRRFVLLVCIAVVSACKGSSNNPNAPDNMPPVLTQAQTENLAAEMARAIRQASQSCVARGFNVNGFGTFPVNESCTATRICNPGGSIQPSVTVT